MSLTLDYSQNQPLAALENGLAVPQKTKQSYRTTQQFHPKVHAQENWKHASAQRLVPKCSQQRCS